MDEKEARLLSLITGKKKDAPLGFAGRIGYMAGAVLLGYIILGILGELFGYRLMFVPR